MLIHHSVRDRLCGQLSSYFRGTKAKAVRLAMEYAVKHHLRQEGFDAMDAGDLDFSEIVETAGPRNADGSLKRNNGHTGSHAA